MLWQNLTDISQLQTIINISNEQSANGLTVLIFKHSTRCGTSAMALNRLESKWQGNENIQPYFLDLLAHREISTELADIFGVRHESPQVLLIRDGKCIYHNSHTGISYQDIIAAAAA